MSRSYVQYLLCMAVVFTSLSITTILSSTNKSPPRIVKQPPAGELLFDDENHKSFLLECEAEGEPVPEYQWTKDGRNFDWQTKKHLTLQTHGTLNFTEATSKDEGQYQCFANNTFGTATSNSAMVVENYKYLFKIERKNEIELTVYEGEPFNITCGPTPTGRPKPTFDWLTEIQNKDSNKAHSSVNDKRMTVDPYGTLWFSYVVLNDSNTTFVFAPTMREQKLRCPTKLKVEQVENGLMNIPPEIQYVSPKNEKVLLGGEIELFCIYSGNPLPEIVWFKNGSIIKITENVKTRNYYKSLLIQNVTIEDKGSYMCNVSNNEGFKWHTIDLEVMVKPYFNIAPKILETLKGETAEIVCEANGHPKPEIIWIYNGRPLNEELPNPRRSVTSNSITITALTKNDTGNYGCNATNSLGYVYKDVYINVLELIFTSPPLDNANITPTFQDQPQETSSSGWWIGVIVLIILISSVVILYIIKNKRTGLYIIRRSEKEVGQVINIDTQLNEEQDVNPKTDYREENIRLMEKSVL